MRVATQADRRSSAQFTRATAALARSTGRGATAAPLSTELRSSLALLIAVLGLPLLVIVLMVA